MGRGSSGGGRYAFARRERRSPLLIVGLPLLFVTAATGIALALPHSKLPAGVPATMYLVAVFASAFATGLAGGIVASLLALVGLDLFFLPTMVSLGSATTEDSVLLIVFVVAAAGAALAVQRLRDARSAAEEERIRAAALAALTADLANASSVADVGEVLTGHMTSALGAKAAGAFVLDPSGTKVRVLAHRGYPEELMERWRSFGLDADVPASEAIRDRRPIVLGSLGERMARYAYISRDRPTMGAGAMAALPVLIRDQAAGAVTLSFSEDHRFTGVDLAFLETLVLQAAQAIERTQLRDAEHRAQERVEFVAEASRALARSLDYTRTLEEVARLAIPRFADWAAVDLLADDGTIELAAVAHRDPAMVRWARELRERIPPQQSDPTGVGAVIRMGHSEFYPDLVQEVIEQQAQSAEQLEVIRRLQPRSVIIAPLVAREKVLGAIALILSEGERRFGPEDLEVAEDLAGRAAIAIDNARLYRAESDAREAVEEGEARLRVLSAASRALASSLDLNATLEEAARLAVDHMADSAIVYLAAADGSLSGVAFAHVDPGRRGDLEALDRIYRPSRNPASHVLRAFRTGLPQTIEDVDMQALTAEVDPDVAQALRSLRVASGLALPLSLGPRAVGVLALAWTERHRIPAEDVALGEELARRMARAIENARLYEERDHAARTLQHSLLPPSIPRIPGVEVAARYRAAGATNEVGGDFYDVFEAGGAWIISIGDVCGKGPEAAAVMAIARYTTPALALHETRPSALLAALNGSLLTQSPDGRFCTACCARLHRFEGRHRLTVACGGHPRPVRLRADGAVEVVGRHGTLLGAMPEVTLWDDVLDLDPGDTVVFYTDGVERPGEPVEDTMAAFLRRVGAGEAGGRDPEAIADAILDSLADSGSPRTDDVALVVLRVEANPAQAGFA